MWTPLKYSLYSHSYPSCFVLSFSKQHQNTCDFPYKRTVILIHGTSLWIFDSTMKVFYILPLITLPSIAKAKSKYTVVKWGHTEGIEREKTSSQKFTVIALDFWRDRLFSVFQIWGQNTIRGQFLEHCHLIWNCPWFLKIFIKFEAITCKN